MKQYNKLGLIFVTDLIWQKQTEHNKISINQYANECGFNLYCKYSSPFGLSYGFTRLSSETDSKKIKKKHSSKYVSLGVWIIESFFDDAVDENLIVCFCFNKAEELYGYIAIAHGSVLAEDGEYIGNLDEVRARTKSLIKQHSIKIAIIPDDVPFYNDSVLEHDTGVRILPQESKYDPVNGKLTSASDFLFWSPDKKSVTPKLKVSRLKTIDLNRNKKIIGFFVGVFAFLSLSYFVYDKYFTNTTLEDLQEQVIPLAKPTSYPAKMFITACLDNYDKRVINTSEWATDNYRCSLTGIDVSYRKLVDAKLSELTNQLGESVLFNAQGATAKFKINLPTSLPDSLPSNNDNFELIDMLNNAAAKLNFTVNINQDKVEITSGYSPVFLYNNMIIDRINISEISMSVDSQSGFNSWRILGDLNVKK